MATNPAPKTGALRALSLMMTAFVVGVGAFAPVAGATHDVVPVDTKLVDGAVASVVHAYNDFATNLAYPVELIEGCWVVIGPHPVHPNVIWVNPCPGSVHLPA